MIHSLRVMVFLCVSSLMALGQTAAVDSEAAYSRTIRERAEKIVAGMHLTNAASAEAVTLTIAQQYRDLRTIHDSRDRAIAEARRAGSEDTNRIARAEGEARVALQKLHGDFLAKLGRHLAADQVDQVKDGMTYGVVPVTYNAYLKMFPELTDSEKKQVHAWLLEAREIAMDQGTSKEKHAVFGKYKGRINNFLSRAGYDLKKGEQNLRK